LADEAWDIQNFGECFADWLQTSPPVEWREPVHDWIRGLYSDVVRDAHREPELDTEEWAGWYCDVPGAGNAMTACVVYYRTHKRFPITRCVVLQTLPRYRE